MHEYSIIENILKIIDNIVLKNNIKNIKKIKLRIGLLVGINETSFLFYFKNLSKNKPYENANLNIEYIKPLFYCSNCNKIFEKDYIIDICPYCGNELKIENLSDDLIIESIEYDN